MFNDEEPLAFKKMHEFSTADGFVEVSENLAEMIEFVANEPSVGLFYIQQHIQNAVPNVINLKNNVLQKSRGMILHTEDLEDSISTMKSMKECGLPIADEMIREIKNSLAIMSVKQPKKGVINSANSSFQLGRATSWGPSTWRRNTVSEGDGEKTSGYLSNVLRSAKEKASNLKWPQLDPAESGESKGESYLLHPNPTELVADGSTSSFMTETEADELPLSSQTPDCLAEETLVDEHVSQHQLYSLSENFEEFRAVREAKLEEWLGGTDDQGGEH